MYLYREIITEVEAEITIEEKISCVKRENEKKLCKNIVVTKSL